MVFQALRVVQWDDPEIFQVPPCYFDSDPVAFNIAEDKTLVHGICGAFHSSTVVLIKVIVASSSDHEVFPDVSVDD